MDAEKLKQKILDLAIRGKLVPQDPNDEPASVLIEKIKAERVKLVKEGKIKASKEESYIFKGSDNFYYENGVSKIEFNPNLDCSNFIVWIKGSDIIYPMQTTKPNGYSFDYIDIDAIDNKNQKISQPKTLLVKDAPSRASRKVFPNSTIFSLVRPYLRNIALVGKKYENCIASTGFYVLTPLPFIDEQYLFLLLTSDYIVNSLNYYMKGDNSPSITTTVIENFYFPIPPISYQKRIVRLFDLINPLIEQIKNSSGQIRTYCKAIKNKVLDLYFGENSSYKSYYPSCAIKDVCKLENGEISNKGSQPYLEAKVIRGTKVPEQRQSGIFIEKGTKVILVDGENSGEIMTAPFSGYMGSTFKIFSANLKMIDEDYLSYFILLKKQELREAKTGSAIPHLNKKLFNQYEIIVPPLYKQKEIVKEITTVFNVLNKIV